MQIAPSVIARPMSVIAPLVPATTMSLTAPPVATPATPPATPVGYDHIFDFQGIAAGQKFHLDKGSSVNGWSISGEGRLDALTPTSASVWVRGGKFGFHKEATIAVTQTSPTTVHMIAQEPGQTPMGFDADIVTVRPGFSEFHPTGIQAKDAILQMDASGRLILDADDSLDGLTLHMVLAKDAAEAVSRANMALVG